MMMMMLRHKKHLRWHKITGIHDLDLSRVFLHVHAPMFLSKLLITTQTEVLTYLHALLISQKPLIE